MQVGDRIEFIRDNSNSGGRYGREGEIGTVVRFNGESGSFEFDNPERREEIGFNPGFYLRDVRILVAEPEEPIAAREPVYVYVAYMKTIGNKLHTCSHHSEEKFLDMLRGYEQQRNTILSKKRIKITL